jgi:hypothetical protein
MQLARNGLGGWNDGGDTVREKREMRHRRSFIWFPVLSPRGMKQNMKTNSRLTDLELAAEDADYEHRPSLPSSSTIPMETPESASKYSHDYHDCRSSNTGGWSAREKR